MSAIHCLINIIMVVVVSLLISMWWQESLLLEQDVQPNDADKIKSNSQSVRDKKSDDKPESHRDESSAPGDGAGLDELRSEHEVEEPDVPSVKPIKPDATSVEPISAGDKRSESLRVISDDTVSNNESNVNDSNSISSVASGDEKIDNIRQDSERESIVENKNWSCNCNNVIDNEQHNSGSDNSNHKEEENNIGTSVICTDNNYFDRQCYFENLYYLPDLDEFAFLHTNLSEIVGVPVNRFNPALTDLSTVVDHNAQYFNYIDLNISESHSLYQNLSNSFVVHEHCLIMRRFNPDNIMHVFHDDLLPIYHTIKTWNASQQFWRRSRTRNNAGAEDKDNLSLRLVFVEGLAPGMHADFYKMFSINDKYKPLYINDLKTVGKIIRFNQATVGLSKHTVWYQYGFSKPQGPTVNPLITSRDIRSFTDFVRNNIKHLSLRTTIHKSDCDDDESSADNLVTCTRGDPYQSADDPTIDMSRFNRYKRSAVLLKRESTRLILNELELSLALAQKFSVRVNVLSLEKNSISEIIETISTADMLVGMHGSLLIMSMFLPSGSSLVELFPYAINSSLYTPYRTLAALPGMNIQYFSWTNQDKSHSVSHPDWPAHLGGIRHLPEQEQKRIEEEEMVKEHLCCSDASWLYHINQDTRVDVKAVTELLSSAVSKESGSNQLTNEYLVTNDYHVTNEYHVAPSRVRNVTCVFHEETNFLEISWLPSANLEYIEIEDKSVSYELWLEEVGGASGEYSAYIVKQTFHKFYVIDKNKDTSDRLMPDTEYNVFVRCLLGATVGPFVTPSSPCRTL